MAVVDMGGAAAFFYTANKGRRPAGGRRDSMQQSFRRPFHAVVLIVPDTTGRGAKPHKQRSRMWSTYVIQSVTDNVPDTASHLWLDDGSEPVVGDERARQAWVHGQRAKRR